MQGLQRLGPDIGPDIGLDIDLGKNTSAALVRVGGGRKSARAPESPLCGPNRRGSYPRSSDSAFFASLKLGLIFNARSSCCRACSGWCAFW